MGSREYTGRARSRGRQRLFGVNPVLEQIRRDPGRILRIRVAKDSAADARIRGAAERAGIPVTEAPAREIRSEAGASGQGVIAEVREFRYASVEDLGGDCLVVADQVTDPRNLGALIRSAEALGATGLILPGNRSALVTPVVEKAAAGATASLPIAIAGNLASTLEQLKKRGYWVVGLDAAAETSIRELELPEKAVLVLGSEGTGMRVRTRASCDFLVSIPLTGRVTSLNVSVAGAIAVFCLRTNRQLIDSTTPR